MIVAASSAPLFLIKLVIVESALLGIDHERLRFRYQGRDFKLTDVAGKVVKEVLA